MGNYLKIRRIVLKMCLMARGLAVKHGALYMTLNPIEKGGTLFQVVCVNVCVFRTIPRPPLLLRFPAVRQGLLRCPG